MAGITFREFAEVNDGLKGWTISVIWISLGEEAAVNRPEIRPEDSDNIGYANGAFVIRRTDFPLMVIRFTPPSRTREIASFPPMAA